MLDVRAAGPAAVLAAGRRRRPVYQYANATSFCEPLERITGRTSRAFICGIDTVEDVSTETFLLHPAGSTAPSRARRT